MKVAPSEHIRFDFDRIRGGEVMAEGISVEATTLEEATSKATAIRDQDYPRTDGIRLCAVQSNRTVRHK